jgi:hypothetical protein
MRRRSSNNEKSTTSEKVEVIRLKIPPSEDRVSELHGCSELRARLVIVPEVQNSPDGKGDNHNSQHLIRVSF